MNQYVIVLMSAFACWLLWDKLGLGICLLAWVGLYLLSDIAKALSDE